MKSSYEKLNILLYFSMTFFPILFGEGHFDRFKLNYPQTNINGSVIYMERNGRKYFSQVTTRINLLKAVHNWETETDVRRAIRFRYYKNGEMTYESSGDEQNILENSGCNQADKFAFILHGWRQSCNTEWVLKLIERLTYHRGGCIVCIDYSTLAKKSYMNLYRNFNVISNVISEKIMTLITDGFDPQNGYMFGFSYGGQLASSIGRTLGPIYQLRLIDTCDMAGPGFDLFADVDHREAAEHIQCLHSSRDKGTHIYACHQNVRLGNCGYNQPAVTSQAYYSSHGLCVQIYINAFDFPFYAMQTKPPWCVSQNPASNVTRGFTIGYNEDPNFDIYGEIFVPTSIHFPYNLSEMELFALGFIRAGQLKKNRFALTMEPRNRHSKEHNN